MELKSKEMLEKQPQQNLENLTGGQARDQNRIHHPCVMPDIQSMIQGHFVLIRASFVAIQRQSRDDSFVMILELMAEFD
jgi:hypothetical protein